MSPLLTRPVRTGLLVMGLVLGGTLSACGESTGDTTCGEYVAMSAGEKRDLIRAGADESDDEDTQAALEAATDDDLDQVAALVEISCDGVDDDTTLDEVSGG